ncbi:MAG: chloride channel protein, partial [Clostridium sp.]
MYQLDKNTPLGKNLWFFVKWSAVSTLIGLTTGLVGTVFGHLVMRAGAYFNSHRWTLALLPAAGLMIVWIYHFLKEDKNRGTNMVIESIYTDSDISPGTAPAIFLGTILTHFSGGSAGREGAALQMGGSIGNQIGRLMKLDEKDKKIAVMCGMSGAFAALFGTPMAAALFSMEVISIGVMYYAALVPCTFSAFIGAAVSKRLGLAPEAFSIGPVPEFSLKAALLMIVLGVLCALVSELFCIVLHRTEKVYRRYFPSPGRRIAAGAVLIIILTLLEGSFDYNGSGILLIERCFEGDVRYEAFLWKILFTAVTLEAGFKGGEIVPT